MIACLLLGLAVSGADQAEALPDTRDPRTAVEVVDISSLALSPDGRMLAFRLDRPSVSVNRVVLRWYVVPVDGGPAREVAEGGEARFDEGGVLVEEPPAWSPDSRAIYFRKSHAGALQVWRAPAGGGDAVKVTQDEADVAGFELSVDGRAMTYLLGASAAEVEALERQARDNGVRLGDGVELAVGAVGGLRDNGRERSVRLRPGWFTRGGLLDERLPRRVTIRLDDGTRLSDQTLDAWPEVPSQARSRIDRRCREGSCRGVLVAWQTTAPDGSQITAEVDVTGQTALVQERSRAGAFPMIRREGVLAGSRHPRVPCVVDDALYCVEAAATAPPRLVAINRSNGEGRTLFDPNQTLRLASAGIPWRSLMWRAPDGETFGGILIGGGERPAVVVHYYDCHGFLRGGLGDELPIQALAGHGIATLCINTSYLPSGGDAWRRYERGRQAIEAIVERLDGEGQIDQRRLGMQGLSFGSEVTMWLARHTDLLRAASIASVQGEETYYWLNAASDQNFAARFREAWRIGAPDDDPEGWQWFSAARNAASIRVPLLMQLPELEARQSPELHARLRDAGVPTELYVYPGANHIKSQPVARLRVYERNLDWFRFWLVDAVDPAPGKREQYARWSAQRRRFESVDTTGP